MMRIFQGRVCVAVVILGHAAHAAEPRQFMPNDSSIVVAAGDQSFKAEDGDSFWLGAFRMRLDGVDATESGQKCSLRDGQECSSAAREFLTEIFNKNKVTCTFVTGKEGRPKMSYGRYVSRCSFGGAVDEVNRLMLSSGMAFAEEKGASTEYETIVAAAKAGTIGVHFDDDTQHPAVFRRRKREPTRISDSELIAEVVRRWNDFSTKLKSTLRALIVGQKSQ